MELVYECTFEERFRCIQAAGNRYFVVGFRKKIVVFDFVSGKEAFSYDSPFKVDVVEMMIYYPSTELLLVSSFEGTVKFLDPLSGDFTDFFNQSGIYDYLNCETCVDGLINLEETSALMKIECVHDHQSLIVIDWRMGIEEASKKVKLEENSRRRFRGRGRGRRKNPGKNNSDRRNEEPESSVDISEEERNLSKLSVRKLDYTKGIPKSRCCIAIMGMDYFPKYKRLLFTTNGSNSADIVSVSIEGDLNQQTMKIHETSPKWESITRINEEECIFGSRKEYGIFNILDWKFIKIINHMNYHCPPRMLYFQDRFILISMSYSQLQIFDLKNDYSFDCLHEESKNGSRDIGFLRRGVFYVSRNPQYVDGKELSVYRLKKSIHDEDEICRIESLINFKYFMIIKSERSLFISIPTSFHHL